MSAVTSIKLDDSLRERVKHLAQARQRTAHWLLRQAVSEYVEREERREAFKQATLRAWNDYQETGLHLSGQEADQWLAQLEQGQDTEPPPCHA